MKYSIEQLAREIISVINFEDGITQLLDNEVEFKGMTATFEGTAFGCETQFDGVMMYGIDLKSCVLLFDDGDETIFNNGELIELERIIKIYN